MPGQVRLSYLVGGVETCARCDKVGKGDRPSHKHWIHCPHSQQYVPPGNAPPTMPPAATPPAAVPPAATPTPAASNIRALLVTIPVGAEVISALSTDGTIQVTYSAGGATTFSVFDAETGELQRSVQIGTE